MDTRLLIRHHLDAVNARLWNRPLTGFDTETNGLHGPLTVSGFAGPSGTWFSSPELTQGYLDQLNGKVIAAHNLPYDLRTCVREGLRIPHAIWLDTMAAAHLLDENRTLEYLGLKILAPHYLGRVLKDWEDVKDDPAELAKYVMDDALASRDLALLFWDMLVDEGLLQYWLKLECPVTLVIAEMEERGIRLDRAEVERRWREGGARIEEAKQAIMKDILPEYQWTCPREGCIGGTYYPKKRAGGRSTDGRICGQCEGTGLNLVVWNSGDQQAKILHEVLGLPVMDYTESGKPSTDKYALPRLRDAALRDGNKKAVEYIDAFTSYRTLSKLHSTYYGPWLESGLERVQWSTHTVSTGRWATSGPNMQNIPAAARSCFIPDGGKVFVSVDFVQIELYLLALMAGETAIIEAYRNGEDLHALTTKAMGLDPENPDDRKKGKTQNFALVYGIGDENLALKLNVSVSEAQALRRQVAGYFRALDPYKIGVINNLNRDGFVRTMLGRKRRLPQTPRGERQAVNFTIQGTAAEFIKSALILSRLNEPAAEPMLQIHDEILYQVPNDSSTPERVDNLKRCFESCYRSAKPRADAVVFTQAWEREDRE